MATEQNNWVILDRRTVMKCNAVTALVLTVLEKDIECYAKSITVVIFGLQGLVDCELVFIRGEKEISKKLLACVNSHVTRLPCLSHHGAQNHARYELKVKPEKTLRAMIFRAS